METTCTMFFGTTGNGRASLRVPKAKTDLTAPDVRAAMAQILSAAAIQTATGKINAMEKAVLRNVTTRDFDLN